jgi:hypothetical protein
MTVIRCFDCWAHLAGRRKQPPECVFIDEPPKAPRDPETLVGATALADREVSAQWTRLEVINLTRKTRQPGLAQAFEKPVPYLGHRGLCREIEAHLVQFLRRKALTMRCPLLVLAQFDANHSLLN